MLIRPLEPGAKLTAWQVISATPVILSKHVEAIMTMVGFDVAKISLVGAVLNGGGAVVLEGFTVENTDDALQVWLTDLKSKTADGPNKPPKQPYGARKPTGAMLCSWYVMRSTLA
jgi:hypothetical protein